MSRAPVLAALVLPLVLAQCGREERSLITHGEFTAERSMAADAALQLEARVFDVEMPAADFDPMWRVVTRGSSAVPAIAVTLQGGGEPDASGMAVLAAMVLVLPTPLGNGAVWPIGRVYAPASEVEMPMYWHDWGPRELSGPGEAGIVLRIFDYHSVGMRVENDFIARTATGTVRVLGRGDDAVQLRLDITATNEDDATVRLHGDFQLRAERYTPPS
jgi:hypothetical protein